MGRGWEAHERHVQDVLGLDSTAASGAKFHDIGDAVDRRHPSESDFRLLADAKYTERGSYSLNAKFLRQMSDKAAALGRRFVLPVRFWPVGSPAPEDYVVVGLGDFAELVARWT